MVNSVLFQLKMTTGKTVQALNTLKNLLHQRLAESEWLSKEVTSGELCENYVLQRGLVKILSGWIAQACFSKPGRSDDTRKHATFD